MKINPIFQLTILVVALLVDCAIGDDGDVADADENEPDWAKDEFKFDPEKDKDYVDAKYFDDGSCAVLKYSENGDHKWVAPRNTSYSHLDFTQFKCLSEFHRYAMTPHCGDPWYDLKKYCAMVHFYKNQEIADSWVKESGNGDIILVVLDGCFNCSTTKQLSVELSLKYKMPGGSLFTGCSETVKTAHTITVQAGNQSGFTLPAVFYHRKCLGLFSHDPMPDAYEEIKLEVKHNCAEEGQQSFSVSLPSFYIHEVPYNQVAEFHFLSLDLDTGKAVKYSGPEETSAKFENGKDWKWDMKPYWENKCAD